ncbi:hypothetical protein KCP74_09970 [Salmonella enterica subsp. enterica]|nr:hypothetical protein KCP74_09970 [Salmonella enterica subsp. enterica]
MPSILTVSTQEGRFASPPFTEKFRSKRRCQSTKHGYHSQIFDGVTTAGKAGYPTLQLAVSTNWQSCA